MKFIGLVGTNSSRSTNRDLLNFMKNFFASEAEIELVEINGFLYSISRKTMSCRKQSEGLQKKLKLLMA